MTLTAEPAERELLEKHSPAWCTTTDICHRCDDWPANRRGALCEKCRIVVHALEADQPGDGPDLEAVEEELEEQWARRGEQVRR